MDIPNGTILDWSGTWTPSTSEWLGSGSAQDISAQLSSMGFAVRSINITSSDILGQLESLGPAAIQGTIEVQTNGGYDYPDAAGETGEQNVADMIASAIYYATGNPATGKIVNVVLPAGSPTGGTAAVPTQVAATQTVKPACPSGISGWFSGLFGSCGTPTTAPASTPGFSLSSLTSGTTMYVAIAIFGFVAALALIGYSGALKRGSV